MRDWSNFHFYNFDAPNSLNGKKLEKELPIFCEFSDVFPRLTRNAERFRSSVERATQLRKIPQKMVGQSKTKRQFPAVEKCCGWRLESAAWVPNTGYPLFFAVFRRYYLHMGILESIISLLSGSVPLFRMSVVGVSILPFWRLKY